MSARVHDLGPVRKDPIMARSLMKYCPPVRPEMMTRSVSRLGILMPTRDEISDERSQRDIGHQMWLCCCEGISTTTAQL
jgi:hypothetical protein